MTPELTPELVEAISLRMETAGVWKKVDQKYDQQELLFEFNDLQHSTCGNFAAMTEDEISTVEQSCSHTFQTLTGLFTEADEVFDVYERAYTDHSSQDQAVSTTVTGVDNVEAYLSHQIDVWFGIIKRIEDEMDLVQTPMALTEYPLIFVGYWHSEDAALSIAWHWMLVKNRFEFNRARKNAGFRGQWPDAFITGPQLHGGGYNFKREPRRILPALELEFVQQDECPICRQSLTSTPDLSFGAEEASSDNEAYNEAYDEFCNEAYNEVYDNSHNGAYREKKSSADIGDDQEIDSGKQTQPGAAATPCCDQLLHVACIMAWCLEMEYVHETCPYCRRDLTATFLLCLMELRAPKVHLSLHC